MYTKTFELRTSYGFQVQSKSSVRASSLRETNGEAEQNIYSQDPADVPLTGKDNEKDVMVSIQLSTLTEREDEDDFFTNKAATETNQDMNLSDDIAKELNEETQMVQISFDEPGEETKL